jgi:hypothetical protein
LTALSVLNHGLIFKLYRFKGQHMKVIGSFCFIALLCSSCAFLSPTIGATPTLATERDHQVMEALLLHLLADPKFDMAKVATNGATIVLHTRTPEDTGYLAPEQIRVELSGRRLPADAESDLRGRNTPQGRKPDSFDAVAVSYTNFTFAAGIVVTNLNEMSGRRTPFFSFERAQPKARGWLEAYLPGYSKDGNVAVVRAEVGPWAHAAMLTAVLEKRGNGWKVKWYKVARFV